MLKHASYVMGVIRSLQLETNASIAQRLLREDPVEFTFFWGHKARTDGQLGASCLSHWWPSPLVIDGEEYPTGEHYLMAKKAALFGDEQTLASILTTPSPAVAKDLGRTVRGYVDEEWAAVRGAVALRGNLAKFSQHEHLCEFLLSTGNSVLVGASPVDAIWGIGIAVDDVRAREPREWPGDNLLGFVLMEVRRLIASGDLER